MNVNTRKNLYQYILTGPTNWSTIENIIKIDDNINRVRANFQTHLARDGFVRPVLPDWLLLTSSSHILWNLSALKCPSSLPDNSYKSLELNPLRYALTITEFIQCTDRYWQHPEPGVSKGKIRPSLMDWWFYTFYYSQNISFIMYCILHLLWIRFPWQYEV